MITALTKDRKRTFSCKLAGQVHEGKWAIFQFVEQTMQWIPTLRGKLSYQYEPILAGYELHYGNKEGQTNDPINKTDFYFARSEIEGKVIFGRTGSIQIPDELRDPNTLTTVRLFFDVDRYHLIRFIDWILLRYW